MAVSTAALQKMLADLSPSDREKLFPGIDDALFQKIMKLDEEKMEKLLSLVVRFPGDHIRPGSPAVSPVSHSTARKKSAPRWFDKPICGLSKEGAKHLKDLTEQLRGSDNSHITERRQIRYLKKLKNMRIAVPDFFREEVNPKQLYRRLLAFCDSHDIPQEIISKMVPALVAYIQTGHMRPIIFIGEKGCGKTTAVRLLVKEALHIPTEVIKVPQLDGSHGMTGDCGTYQAADAGCIAIARIRLNSLIVAYLFDEIDKTSHSSVRASVDEELLSITDESCSEVYDNFLETTLVGLEHCPMFFTGNDLSAVSPILADRCTIIHFPNASADRIKSISRKFAGKKLSESIYRLIRFDYALMDRHIDRLVSQNITSIRKHQQMIEAVLASALNDALNQKSDDIVTTTEEMFSRAENAVAGGVKRKSGFVG